MEDGMSRGLPFEVVDLWQAPACLTRLEPDDSVFDAWHDTVASLELAKGLALPDVDVALEMPALEEHKEDLQPPASSVESHPDPYILSSPHRLEHLDVWPVGVGVDGNEEHGQLCAWEAFAGPGVPALADLVGAGVPALADLEGRIGVLPRDGMLRCLAALALGRSSTLFSWNEREHTFQQTRPGAAVPRHSAKPSESLVAHILSVGNQITRLRAFSHSVGPARHTCPAASALESCIGELLDAVDESLAAALSTVPSCLRLQQVVQLPRQLLHLMSNLVDSVKGCQSDESVISALSHCIHHQLQGAGHFGHLLQSLLTRVSLSWLDGLRNDLGFTADSLRTDNERPGKASYNAAFVGPEDRALLSEATSAVALLRVHHPRHILLGTQQTRSCDDSPAALFTSCDSDPHTVVAAAQLYQDMYLANMSSKAQQSRQIAPGATMGIPELSLSQASDSCDTYLTDLEAAMSQSAIVNSPQSLREKAIAGLRGHELSGVPASSHLLLAADISPIARLRPLIATQHRLVNGVILRHLLREQKLRTHLEVQRAFQMFGNGHFVSRMCAALFSEDVQSAEHKRGTVPTAETVGLRLGASHDERWPPASSELQLSLMGILSESAGASSTTDLLSFAIREMPEEEIERVLDPHSIYALDFLRLQHNVTSPLDAVLTADALGHCDEIFRFLLKLLRLVHATGDLSKRVLKGSHPPNASSFAQEAQLFISVIVSHVMDLGIAPPWQELIRSVTTLELRLQEEDERGEIGTRAHLGIEGLRQVHEACLDRIRRRLFLKREHQKVRCAVESALASLLKATCAAGSDTLAPLAHHFHLVVKKLVGLLKLTADTAPKSLAAADVEDVEALRTLVSRLNWNGHYEHQDRTW